MTHSFSRLSQYFDWEFYLEIYKDLRRAGLCTKEQAIHHYLCHGYYENRIFHPSLPLNFDWYAYVKNHSDFKAHGIITKEQAYDHFIVHGQYEKDRVFTHLLPNRVDAVICAIALNEERYIDEWIEYHFRLGFQCVYLYDNSVTNDLESLSKKYGNKKVFVIHFPGKCRQLDAYNHFVNTYRDKHEWGAFIDIDEFIVLRKYRDICDFLVATCKTGSVGLNWIIFGSSHHEKYEAKPVLERFTLRSRCVNKHIKIIACLMDISHFTNPHFCILKNNTSQKDPHGRILPQGPFNVNYASEDVACIHHYFGKSKEEFEWKAMRGDASRGCVYPFDMFESHDENDLQDMSALSIYDVKRTT